MKKLLMPLAALLLLGTALLGRKAVKSHLSALRTEVKTTVREATPADYEVKRIRALIGDMSEDVLAFTDKINEVAQSAAVQKKEIAELEERMAADRTDLLTERNLLAQEKPTYTIRGTVFSRAQVEASCLARLGRINRDQAVVATKKQAGEKLDSAVREGRTRLQEAVAARDAKLQELEMLEAQLANAELKRELFELAAPLEGTTTLSRSRSELAESMKSFGDRVRRVERQTEATTQANGGPGLISHSSETQSGLLEQIDRFLLTPSTSGKTNP